MTTGFLTADREPALSLEIRGPDGAQSFDAVIDTGYNGALTLPPDWIDALGLPQSGEERGSLADGRVIVVPMYVGYVILDEQAYEVDVATAQTRLQEPLSSGASPSTSSSKPTGAVRLPPCRTLLRDRLSFRQAILSNALGGK